MTLASLQRSAVQFQLCNTGTDLLVTHQRAPPLSSSHLERPYSVLHNRRPEQQPWRLQPSQLQSLQIVGFSTATFKNRSPSSHQHGGLKMGVYGLWWRARDWSTRRAVTGPMGGYAQALQRLIFNLRGEESWAPISPVGTTKMWTRPVPRRTDTQWGVVCGWITF